MKLVALPAFADNYIWMLHDGARAVVVDPGDAAPVTAALERLDVALASILVTHHHGDHTGGIADLLQRQGAQRVAVWAPAREALPPQAQPLQHGDRPLVAGLPAGAEVSVLAVPGHTAGHIAYVLRGVLPAPLLFCGDTLFSAGCGRLFEGTADDLARSLALLAALPDDTLVCCAHEYTESNLRFAAAVEPDNAHIAQAQADCARLRAAGQPTLPSTIGRERLINPFLRCTEPVVVASARAHGADNGGAVSVLAALRAWKNRF